SLLSCFFFSSRRRHTRFSRDWSSDVCSSDLSLAAAYVRLRENTCSLPVKPTLRECLYNSAKRYRIELSASVVFAGNLRSRQTERSEERRVGKECRSRWVPEQ